MSEIGPRMLMNELLDLHQAQIGIIPRSVLSSCSCCANRALRSIASAAARLRDWNTISQIVTITMKRVVKNNNLSTCPGGDRIPPTKMHSEAKAPAQVNCVGVHAITTIQTSGTFNSQSTCSIGVYLSSASRIVDATT
jgi:hypothetical protein